QAKPEEAEAKPEEAKPADPNLDAHADSVWAKVLRRPGQEKGEVQEVYLRGNVAVHQDPPPDKSRGTDIAGDAVDVLNNGPGRALLVAHGAPAVVITEEMTLQGPHLGLDQAMDFAWVDGPGRLTQRSRGGSLVADARAGEAGDKQSKASSGPLDVIWARQM